MDARDRAGGNEFFFEIAYSENDFYAFPFVDDSDRVRDDSHVNGTYKRASFSVEFSLLKEQKQQHTPIYTFYFY